MLIRTEKLQAVIAKLVGTASIHLGNSLMTDNDWKMAIKYTRWFLGFGADAWIKEVKPQISGIQMQSKDFNNAIHHKLGLLREQMVLKVKVIDYLPDKELDAILKCPADFLQLTAATWINRITPSKQVGEWAKFYTEVLNYKDTTDIVNARLPEEHPRFQQLIVVDPSLSMYKVIDAFRELCGVGSINDDDFNLASMVQYHPERAKKNTYTVITCRSDAFRNDTGKSVQRICNEEGIRNQSLLEYLLWHMFHYWKHKEHLDDGEQTICGDSQFQNYDVPVVYWDWRLKRFRIEQRPTSWWNPSAGVREVRIAM